jgi:hypothetical protein
VSRKAAFLQFFCKVCEYQQPLFALYAHFSELNRYIGSFFPVFPAPNPFGIDILQRTAAPCSFIISKFLPCSVYLRNKKRSVCFQQRVQACLLQSISA